MAFGGPAQKLMQVFNGAVTALAGSPRWGRLVSGRIASISYVGRKSGRRDDRGRVKVTADLDKP